MAGQRYRDTSHLEVEFYEMACVRTSDRFSSDPAVNSFYGNSQHARDMYVVSKEVVVHCKFPLETA